MRLRVSCDLDMNLEVASPLLLMLRPRSGAQQWILRESYEFSRAVTVAEHSDLFGNLCQRLVAPAGDFGIHTSAEVETPARMDSCPGAPFVTIENLPVEVLVYLAPSRYCESDRVGELSRDLVAGEIPGYDQVRSIAAWIRDNVEYLPGSSELPLSADEARRQGHGVCRDLAHLGIALCRGISIPSRMVVGYLAGLKPMDLHAWFEAWVGDRWYTFDPTQPGLEAPRVAIAYGRDAADVAIYHQFGPLPTTSSVAIRVEVPPG